MSRSSPWAAAQVVSVVFNEWSHEKGVILDVGWSFLDRCTHPPTFRSTVHLEVEEKRTFGNRGKQRVVSVRSFGGVGHRNECFHLGIPVWSK